MVTKGLIQGCCITPTIFKIYIARILQIWKNNNTGTNVREIEKRITQRKFLNDNIFWNRTIAKTKKLNI